MKIYILNRVSELTSNYHEGGGLVVVANDIDHAKELLSTNIESANVTDEEWSRATVGDTSLNPQVFVFPDSGCC